MEDENIKLVIQPIINTEIVVPKIIFINDHSNDGGDKRLTEWVLSIEKDVSLLSLSDSAFGKKQAINLGVSNAVTDWIFTLDADSYISSNFLNRFIKEMEDSILLYLLPVLENDKGFFLSKIESIITALSLFASVIESIFSTLTLV
jgi:glycosyltransferase involved in cell wall biosynthesis